MKRLFILMLCSAMLLTFTACQGEDSENSGSNEGENTTEEAKELSYGSTFTFDDLEITIGNAEDITWTTVENQYSEENGSDVIVLPVTIKNLKDETHSLNMFYYSFFGSNGTSLDSVSAYFSDTDVALAGSIRSGASLDSAFHILYDGDGDYYIEFNDLSTKIEVKLPIAKETASLS